jgi:hypothetical protein
MGLEALEERRFLSAGGLEHAAPPADHGQPPHVFAAGSTVNGKTLGAWSAEHWKWFESIPVGTDFADVAQSGPVFFLASPSGSGEFIDDITIPAGKRVFFPVLDIAWITFPEDPILPVQEYRNIISPIVDGFTDLHATIDGKSIDVSTHREVDPYVEGFEVTVPDANHLGLPAGTYGPCVSDGYFLMFSPLSPGQHELSFGGSIPAFGAELNVTFHITVVPQGQRRNAPAPQAAAAQRAPRFGAKPIGGLFADDQPEVWAGN